ncbi:MAG: NAD(P)/FAD-dependent oxidoreductase [Erysipelotrichaceae bacterium]|nr:NAD(P)/FAD-dependent oxidoreductase [Erysipelotrichaceae bacterium]
MKDVTIIGAGITGALIAHELSKYELDVLVLEKDSDAANGATGANSAMVHSGHDPKPGTLKCRYNLEGNRMFPDLCKELQVAYDPVGAFVVATSIEEEEKLEVLKNQCIERNVPYEILSGDKAREEEPNLSDDVSMALSLPTTGIITPWEVTFAALEEAYINSTEVRFDYEVKNIERKDDCFLINNEIETKVIINCAGAHCDDITNMLRVSPYKVETKKGEYYILDHTGQQLVRHVIYPVPTSKGKGVLAVPTVHHNVLIGPNSDFIEDKDDSSTGEGLDYVKREINKTIKNIPFNKMIHTFAGLRPHIDLNDFYIKEDDEIRNFIHVAGIESPGLSASPAIAKDVVENIVIPKFDTHKKDKYDRRRPFIKMNEMSLEERRKLIEENPDFGKLVCRCEKISLGEIKDVINRPLGAKTIKGVKMRCRPGMGRCQGGFCEPEVVRILQKELDQDYKDIRMNNKGSEVFVGKAREEL